MTMTRLRASSYPEVLTALPASLRKFGKTEVTRIDNPERVAISDSKMDSLLQLMTSYERPKRDATPWITKIISDKFLTGKVIISKL